ncbi:MAG: FxLYD domain-containing protein [Limisphaerales bacterium]
MSDSGYFKCACSHCQERIEFPAYAAGVIVTCPHCGVETRLIAPDAPDAPGPAAPPPPPPPPPQLAIKPSAPPPAPEVVTAPLADAAVGIIPVTAPSTGSKLKKALSVVFSVLAGLVVLALIGFKVWTKFRRAEHLIEAVKEESNPENSKSAPAPPAASDVIAGGAPPRRKPGEDLQVLDFEIQKASDGSLQYITGTVTNHSAKQYFNVKLEFELTRKDGKPGDQTTDSIRNISAKSAVPFKASIIGTAPVASAKLTKLEGEKE